MKKLIGGVKRAFSSRPSSRGSGSCSDDGSQDSTRSTSFVSLATDGDDNSIYSIEEMEKYKSLRERELRHTYVYDVNLLDRVGMDEVLPLILRTIG
jgi:hypothetical protein